MRLTRAGGGRGNLLLLFLVLLAAGGVLACGTRPLHEPPPQLSYLVHARDFPTPFRLAQQDRLRPPPRLSGFAWRTYPLSPAALKRKQAALRTYKSQRIDPYLRLLLDSFVRRNELFVDRSGTP